MQSVKSHYYGINNLSYSTNKLQGEKTNSVGNLVIKKDLKKNQPITYAGPIPILIHIKNCEKK